jgi:uncharacterized protein YbgA (DUF1722 family)/uncharacterized protein YbbK (DUF523 family)
MKPVVVVSRCLGFEACRYNGDRLDDPFVSKLAAFVSYRPVCPEADIGMGTPRPPVRLVARGGERRLLQPDTKADFSESMRRFSETYLDGLGEVDGFILKNRSPSCAVRDAKVYSSERHDAPSLGREPGLFARAVLEKFPGAAVEDEGRLQNFRIREHFLTKLFALARWRSARKSGSMRQLVRFHSEYKLLLMAYSQSKLRLLGKVVANHEKLEPAQAWSRYQSLLVEALARPPRYTSNINVLMHALGYFSQRLSAREKAHFLDVLDHYRQGKYPLSAAIAILRSWLARFDEPYLEQQVFLEPYPSKLVEITDSGKGRGKV